MTVLHSRPFRSVRLEARAGAPVVVKRFHHPKALLARFDARRARREFEALVALERAGLPVPHPLELRSSPDGWELSLAPIPEARTLQDLLQGGAPPAGGWPRLLARLGELLARLQTSGWEHGDLHPGNLLVDARGDPWLIDLQRARRVAPDAARRLDEVVECAAVTREHLPARTRARFLVAWRTALPGALRPVLDGTHLARAVEERARRRRRERVNIGLGRWLRASSRVRRIDIDGSGAWLRHGLEPAALACAERWLWIRGEHAEVCARWLGAARLAEHGLAVARPAAFAPGTRAHGAAWAAFEPAWRTAKDAEEIRASLVDRGLALRAPEVAGAGGGLYLLPPREPQDFVEA